MTCVHLGIDPGLDGAVACIERDEIEIRDTPTYQDGKRRRIDAAKCVTILLEIKAYCSPKYFCNDDGTLTMTKPAKHLMVTIEKSQPMPPLKRKEVGHFVDPSAVGHGSIASFSLGYSFGVWVGILAALEIPYQIVSPVTWKRSLMADSPKEKDASRIVADRLFPGQRENWWPLKKHHGRADALLIAEWGRRQSGVLDE